ncbi:Rne/Rng family ribonuclease [Azovibrio restrictus]|uniref:Rne/Rng family ribonuclease n=1 Tax=Azovibrio restrictus TaxID=146938 RepID=UPI0026EE3F76|nr:Rne/Rng family ribonuclease [Azovibrio restrictus]
MKRMLFNATQAEELRVAIVDGQKLIDLDIESAAKEQRKSNIYKGVITRIEPSLEAAFVDYGADRHGFLPFKEISRSYFQPGADSRSSIKEAIKEGQELIVQVDKDERGNKGAALTTYVSLAGRYLVLMPNNPRGGGVSRRVDGEERAELKEAMDQLEVPSGMSLIARTAAIGRQVEELQWDLNYLLQLWRAIEGVSNEQKAPLLIYQEGSLVIRAIRDYFQPEIGEILIDTDEIFEQAQAFMAQVMPGNVNRVKRYRDDVPLFSRFQIEHQIETAFGRQVNLPSGGAIVIDHTEALVAVDVNSGRATKGADIEETALKTNLEAADELARQLRLRDLGGLIVIDFIDMESQKNQREVENRLKDALKFDRARVQMGKISRFGLMELSRQRLRPALAETSYIPCPRCTGTGHIRSTESAALHILRILEEEAMKDNTAAVHVQVPVDVATFLLNEKRADIQAIELRHKVSILLIPNIHLETPAHHIQRLRHDDLNQEDLREPSYKMVETPSEEALNPAHGKNEASKPRQEAAIKNITPEQPAPTLQARPEADQSNAYPGIIARIFSWLKGKPAAPAPAQAQERKPREARTDARRERGEGRRNNRNGRGEGRRESAESSDRPVRENRNERSRASGRGEPRSETREEKQVQEQQQPRERKPRGERRERQPSAPAAVAEQENLALTAAAPALVPALENGAMPQDNGTEGSEEQGSRRRNRRSRGRRNNGETPVHETAVGIEAMEAAAPALKAEQETAPLAIEADARPEPGPVAALPPEAPAPTGEAALPAAEPAAVLAPPAEDAPAAPPAALEAAQETSEAAPSLPPEAPAAAATPQAETAPAAVAEAAAPAPQAPGPAPVLDIAALQKDLEASGLVLVQTTSAPTAMPAPAEPAVPLGRPRRSRPTQSAPADEPLVMVETKQ